MYDIIIVGAGPAGLTAALYARRAEKHVLILEKDTFGGQITFSPKIENYPGFAEISGNELADMLIEQVLAQGAEIELGTVQKITLMEGGTKAVVTESGDTYQARAVIIANGARHRMLGLPGEATLIGKGVSFCAVCDGAFYKGKEVAVVGGGNTALQEAVLLSDGCRKVTVIQNLDHFTGEEKLLKILQERENVELIPGTVVSGLEAEDGELTAIRCRPVAGGEEFIRKLDGLFVAIGLMPDNKDFADIAKLDEWGYFAAGEDCRTATPGVFIAGDCRAKRIRQITTAAADGSVAALAACTYLDEETTS